MATSPAPARQVVLQELSGAEVTEALGAEKGQRTPTRLGYRATCSPSTLVTRVGELELRETQDRHGRFSTELKRRLEPALGLSALRGL
jgi:transposase-like protein